MDFRDWFESRRAATVHPEIKKWLDSADKLKQTVEKLKAVLKDKEEKEKTKPVKTILKDVEPKKPEIKKPEKPEIKKPEIKDKPPEKPVEKVKIEPKNVGKPTKVEKEPDEEKGSQDDRENNRRSRQYNQDRD